MPERETEATTGGLLGKFVGKAKAAAGGLVGNDDLTREGNLQQAHSDAERLAAQETQAAELRRQEVAVEAQRADAAAERERLRTELEAEDRKARIDEVEAQREQAIARKASQERAAINERERLQARAAEATEMAAMHRRTADEMEIARLELAAKQAEQTANVIDPEAK